MVHIRHRWRVAVSCVLALALFPVSPAYALRNKQTEAEDQPQGGLEETLRTAGLEENVIPLPAAWRGVSVKGLTRYQGSDTAVAVLLSRHGMLNPGDAVWIVDPARGDPAGHVESTTALGVTVSDNPGWTADGALIFAEYPAGPIVAWKPGDSQTPRVLAPLPLTEVRHELTGFAVSPDGRTAYYSWWSGHVRSLRNQPHGVALVDLAAATVSPVRNPDSPIGEFAGAVQAVTPSPRGNGQLLWIHEHSFGALEAFALPVSGEPMFDIPFSNPIRQMTASPDGRRLFLAAQPGLWTVDLTVQEPTAQQLEIPGVPRNSLGIAGAVMNADGTLLVMADGALRAFRLSGDGRSLLRAAGLEEGPASWRPLPTDEREVIQALRTAFWIRTGNQVRYVVGMDLDRGEVLVQDLRKSKSPTAPYRLSLAALRTTPPTSYAPRGAANADPDLLWEVKNGFEQYFPGLILEKGPLATVYQRVLAARTEAPTAAQLRWWARKTHALSTRVWRAVVPVNGVPVPQLAEGMNHIGVASRLWTAARSFALLAESRAAGLEEVRTETVAVEAAITQVWDAAVNGRVAQVDFGWPAILKDLLLRAARGQIAQRMKAAGGATGRVTLRWATTTVGDPVAEVKVRPAGTQFIEFDTALRPGDRVIRYNQHLMVVAVPTPLTADAVVTTKVVDPDGRPLPTNPQLPTSSDSLPFRTLIGHEYLGNRVEPRRETLSGFPAGSHTMVVTEPLDRAGRVTSVRAEIAQIKTSVAGPWLNGEPLVFLHPSADWRQALARHDQAVNRTAALLMMPATAGAGASAALRARLSQLFAATGTEEEPGRTAQEWSSALQALADRRGAILDAARRLAPFHVVVDPSLLAGREFSQDVTWRAEVQQQLASWLNLSLEQVGVSLGPVADEPLGVLKIARADNAPNAGWVITARNLSKAQTLPDSAIAWLVMQALTMPGQRQIVDATPFLASQVGLEEVRRAAMTEIFS